jgi:hypothetical protein
MTKITKSLFKIIFLISAGLLIGGLCNFVSQKTVLIESEESKNANLESVYNQIRWIPGKDKNVWMMNQSHYGLHAPAEKWERLAIVIDKTKTPMTAHFYQLKSGPLEWHDDLVNQQTAYRASCYICHNNGPRAIHPKEFHWNSLKAGFWNLRIKTYGRIDFDKAHDIEDAVLKTPFRFHEARENEPLQVKTCLHCHKEEGFLARGLLHRQQTGTITHAVETGHMPPPGFALSDLEKKQLRDFLHGF